MFTAWRTWFRGLICRDGQRRMRSSRPKRRCRPHLEWLEDRITPVAGLTPVQIRTFYGFNAIANFVGGFGAGGGQIADGTGQTIAIVDQYNNPHIIQDLDTFDQSFSLAAAGQPLDQVYGGQTLYQLYGGAVGGPAGSVGPGSFLTVFNQNGVNITDQVASYNASTDGTTGVPGNAPWGSSWGIEIPIDVEWAHAIAPGAKIDLIECNAGGTYTQNILDGVDVATSVPGVSVVSMSVGSWPEFPGETSQDSNQFDAKGVTFVTASGDYGFPAGSYLPQFSMGAPGPGSLAVSPNILVVGGTAFNLDSNGDPLNETAWAGSGGGPSQWEPEPTYQKGENGQPAAQTTGFRTAPDVAFDAATGVAVYDSYDYPAPESQVYATGTSVSTPCWAGLIAIANQGRAFYSQPPLNTDDTGDSPNSQAPQQIMQVLYSHPEDFNHITSGSNAQIIGVQASSGLASMIQTQVQFNNNPNAPQPGTQASALVQTAYGAITGFVIQDGGSGYQTQNPPSVAITAGEGSYDTTTYQFIPTITNGAVTGVQVSINGGYPQPIPAGGIGSGYLSIDFSGGNPTSGQQDTAIATTIDPATTQITDQITGVLMTSPRGAGGYTSTPTATIHGNANNGTTLHVVVNGAVAQPGQSYNQITGLGTPIANLLIPHLVAAVPLDGVGAAVSLAPQTSDHGLAMTAVNGQNYIAWRSNDSHFLNIFPQLPDGTLHEGLGFTSGGFNEPDMTVNSSPTLATLNGHMYVAWAGENDGGQLFVSQVSVNNDGTLSVSTPLAVAGANTPDSGSPALAGFNGSLYLAWADHNNNELQIDQLATDPTTGQLQTSGGDAYISGQFTPNSNLTVKGSPALAAVGGRLYLAFAGFANGGQLYDAQLTATNGIITGSNFVALDQPNGDAENSDQSPALTDVAGVPAIAWIATGNNNHYLQVMPLYSSGYPNEGLHFSSPYQANDGESFDGLNGGPALDNNNGNLWLAWTAPNSGIGATNAPLYDAPVGFPLALAVVLQSKSYTLKLASPGSNQLQVYQGTALQNSYGVGTFSQIQVQGAAGNPLTLDFSNGNFLPPAGLSFDAGSNGQGTLILENGNFTNEVITPTGPNSGTITLDGTPITYSHVSSIIDTTTVTNLTVNGTNSAGEQVYFIMDPKGTENGGVVTDEINSASGTFVKVDFGNKTNVMFAGGSGGDSYTVHIKTAAAKLTTLNVDSAWPGADTFNVLATLPSVPVTIATGAGTSSVNVTPINKNLDSLAGALTVNGGAGGTTNLVVDDQLDPVSQTYYSTGSVFGRLGKSGTISYSNLAGITLNGGTAAANQLAIREGHNGGETWTVIAGAKAGSLQVQGTGADRTPIPGTPITAFGLTTLSIDTTVNAKQKPHPRLAGNTYILSDLSTTGIRNVTLDISESQSGVASPDTITVAGTQASGTADMVDVKHNRALGPQVEDVTLTKLAPHEQPKGGPTLAPVPSSTYTVSAGIPNSGDSLTVNTYQGPDQVHVYATAGAGSTYINTGAGNGPGGDNQIIVGDATSATGLNDIEGPLFIDAGNGLKNSLTFTEAASYIGDKLTLTNDALIRYVSTQLPRTRQEQAQERYLFQISYQATGGAFGGGIELDTTQGPDTVYVPSTIANTQVTIDTEVNNGANAKTPAPDQLFVGYDAGDPTGPPNPENAGTLDQILSPVTIISKGASGTPAANVIIEDQGAKQPETYNLAWLILPGVEALQRSGAAAISYWGTDLAMTLKAGNQGNQIVAQGVRPGTSATINAGNGANTLVVGDLSNNLSAVQGLLTLNGGSGTNNLTLHDEGAGAAAAYHLGASQLIRDPIAQQPAVTIDFSNMTTVDFKASDLPPSTSRSIVSNTIVIQGTAASTPTEVDTEHGANEVTVQKLNMIQGPLTLASLAGAANSLAVDDSAANTPGTYFLNAGTVQGNGSALIQFANFARVELAAGKTQNNTVNVQSTAANVGYVINCTTQLTASTDIYNIGDVNNTLSGILGPVSFLGGHGHGALMIDDQGSTAANTYALTSTTLARSGAATITYKGPTSLAVNGGSGGNVFTVSGTKAGTATLLSAGAGADIIKLSSNANVLAPYPGPLTIDGQGGVNTLDYFGFSGPVTVDLPLSFATAAAGGISNIQNVNGGSGNDLFVGNGSGNVLIGGTGRNVLIAGAGAGTLIGNANQDLLVGGNTKYDTNLLALSAIMAEWASSPPYSVRVPLVLNGGGLNRNYHLGPADFTSNGGGNVLTGGPGLDLFYGSKLLDSNDWNAVQGEVFIEKKVTPTIQVSDAGGTYNGQPFPATATVTGISGVPGSTLEGVGLTLDYQQLDLAGKVQADLGATAPTTAGSYQVIASFPGSTDYTSATSQPAAFTIGMASPDIIWNTPDPITYGTPLSATQLDWSIAGGLAGTFENGPVAGTILGAGTQTLEVYFVPFDRTDYFVGYKSVQLVVKQATPTIQVSDAGGRANGQPYPATATVAGVVAGVDNTPAPTLEGVGLALDYQQWVPTDTGGGAWLDLGPTVPTTVGRYRVIASFAGSTDYTSDSAVADFTISGF